MEHEDSVQKILAKKANDITLEVLGQGLITTLWDDICQCITKSIGDDAVALSRMLSLIRGQVLQVWAVWKDGGVQTLIIVGPVADGFSERKAAMIHAIHGHLSNDDWLIAAKMFEEQLRQSGYSRIVAWTVVPAVEQLCSLLGWTTRTTIEKEL